MGHKTTLWILYERKGSIKIRNLNWNSGCASQDSTKKIEPVALLRSHSLSWIGDRCNDILLLKCYKDINCKGIIRSYMEIAALWNWRSLILLILYHPQDELTRVYIRLIPLLEPLGIPYQFSIGSITLTTHPRTPQQPLALTRGTISYCIATVVALKAITLYFQLCQVRSDS